MNLQVGSEISQRLAHPGLQAAVHGQRAVEVENQVLQVEFFAASRDVDFNHRMTPKEKGKKQK